MYGNLKNRKKKQQKRRENETMSRIGNKPITVPDDVEVTLNENHITV